MSRSTVSPVIVDASLTGLGHLKRETNLALLLVEQHAELALELAPETIVFAEASRELLDDPPRLTSIYGGGRAPRH